MEFQKYNVKEKKEKKIKYIYMKFDLKKSKERMIVKIIKIHIGLSLVLL